MDWEVVMEAVPEKLLEQVQGKLLEQVQGKLLEQVQEKLLEQVQVSILHHSALFRELTDRNSEFTSNQTAPRWLPTLSSAA